jgi:xanthine dehydrogenase accessory factor
MADWLAVIARLSGSGVPCILVTVAETRGSVPRGPGAKMVVTNEDAFGTIGGGQLEYEALRAAREMLADATTAAQLRRFGLGPSLGQCCGGTAHLLFEPMSAGADAWALALERLIERGERAVLVTAIGEPGGKVVVSDGSVSGALGEPRRHAEAVHAARAMLESAGTDVCFEEDQRGGALLFEPIQQDELHVVLFGAGHVGKALVRVLGELPCRVTWVDARAEQFPKDLPTNVTVECTDLPQYAVERAPADASFLVMTYSHALDFTLCEKILRRADFSYFGLIGSATKRAKFVKRFKARGLADHVIARMICPIGIPGLSGKHPGEIAVAVAAQLLMARAGSAQAHSGEQDGAELAS